MALINCPECGKEVSDNAVNCVHCGSPLLKTKNPFANNRISPAQYKKDSKAGRILAIISCVLLALAVIGFLTGEESPDNGADTSLQAGTAISPSPSPAAPSPSPSPKIEYIEISATELLSAYDENEVAADNKYKDQMLKITGTVGNIGKDILDSAYITLSNDDSPYSLISVQCYFDRNNLDDIAELTSGDVVTVTGKCSGSSLNVILKKCDIVK